ncbi:MAG: TrmB family transcriptional regulator sugar-binding domain-containing protein, partial [Nanoarchaeota archaeon]
KPTVILEKLKIDTLRDADEKIKTLSKLKDTAEYEELKQLYNTTIKPIQQSEVSGAIKGKINLYSHIKQLLENAEKEIIICLPASQLLEKSRLFNGLFERLNERGVRVLIGVNCTDEDIKKVNKKYNIRAQKTDIKGKFFIADRKQTLFTLTNSIEDEMGVWFNSEFFSSSLAYLFESALRNGR